MFDLYLPMLLPLIKNTLQEGGIIVTALDITLKFKDGSEQHITKDTLIKAMQEGINKQFADTYIL